MVTADDVRSRTFLVGLRGFDRQQVKDFLNEVADALEAAEERARAVEGTAAPAEPGTGTEAGPATEVEAEPGQAAPAGASPFAELGAETQRILEAAQEAAEQIRSRARADAERELKAARAQAARIIAEGERERETVQRVVEELTGARAGLAEDLRDVGRTIERLLRELAPPQQSATVRQAIAQAAREETLGHGGEPPADQPPADELSEQAPADQPPADQPSDQAPADQSPAGNGGEPPSDAGGTQGDAAPSEAPAEPPAGDAPAATEPPATEPPTAAAGPTTEEPLGEIEQATPVRVGPALGDDLVSPGAAAPAGNASSANGTGRASPAAAVVAEPVAAAGHDALDGPAQRTRALAPLHAKLVRKLKRGLQDIQNATLDTLRRNPERTDVEPFLPDESAVQALAALAEEQLELANAAGIASGNESAGTQADVAPSGRALAGQLGSELGGVLVTRLADTLRSGFDARQGASALAERVDAAFARIKSGPAGDVAAVALVRAYEGGRKDAWVAAGVSHRRWIRATEPACTDPRCVDNESAGAVPVGERFPSRHDAPPVRPGCQCSTAPAGR